MDVVDAISKEVFINAPAANVFTYLVDAAHMKAWMGQVVELDARPGGVFNVDMNGTNIAQGEFVEVEPNRRVVFTWGWQGSDTQPPGSSTVEITLDERDGGTFVRLVHQGLGGEERAQHDGGWEYFLGRLVSVAEGRNIEA